MERRHRMTTEEWLEQPIAELTNNALAMRKRHLDKLMDATTSPQWYAVILMKRQECILALAAR